MKIFRVSGKGRDELDRMEEEFLPEEVQISGDVDVDGDRELDKMIEEKRKRVEQYSENFRRLKEILDSFQWDEKGLVLEEGEDRKEALAYFFHVSELFKKSKVLYMRELKSFLFWKRWQNGAEDKDFRRMNDPAFLQYGYESEDQRGRGAINPDEYSFDVQDEIDRGKEQDLERMELLMRGKAKPAVGDLDQVWESRKKRIA